MENFDIYLQTMNGGETDVEEMNDGETEELPLFEVFHLLGGEFL